MNKLTIYKNANQKRLTRTLVTPSFGSVVASTFFAFLVLAISNWSYVTPDSPLRVYIFGTNGLTTVLQSYTDSLRFISDMLSTNSSYYVMVCIVALLVGFLVFAFLEGADRIADTAKEEAHEVAYVHDPRAKQQVKRGMVTRFGLRVVTAFIFMLYVLCLLRLVIPYSLVLGYVDMAHFWTWNSLGSLIGATGLLVLALHIAVIILRLLMLRPRVFGRVIR